MLCKTTITSQTELNEDQISCAFSNAAIEANMDLLIDNCKILLKDKYAIISFEMKESESVIIYASEFLSNMLASSSGFDDVGYYINEKNNIDFLN